MVSPSWALSNTSTTPSPPAASFTSAAVFSSPCPIGSLGASTAPMRSVVSAAAGPAGAAIPASAISAAADTEPRRAARACVLPVRVMSSFLSACLAELIFQLGPNAGNVMDRLSMGFSRRQDPRAARRDAGETGTQG